MKKVVAFYKKIPFVLVVAVALVIGVVLGIFAKNQTWISIFGDIFVGALKAYAPILVFVLVTASIAKASNSIGKRFRTVIILYMVTTLIAAVVAVVASKLFPVTLTLTDAATETAPETLFEVIRNLIINAVSNPIAAIMNGNYLCIIVASVLFGVCLKKVGRPATIDMVEDIANAVSKVISYVIKIAPLGILGLVFTAVSTNGLGIFEEYGQLILVLVGAMIFSSLVLNPILVGVLLKKNPYPLVFTCIAKSGLTAFFTRSSAANIPMNMDLCEGLGLDEDFYSVSIPLGSTINMDGAAITITVMTLALCNTMGIQVNFFSALFLSLVAVIAACGASGVAGGSLLLIPLACSLFGINNDIAMQAVAVGFIIGVIQDSVETALNSSGDAIFTATAEYYDRKKKGEDMRYLGKFAKKKKAE